VADRAGQWESAGTGPPFALRRSPSPVVPADLPTGASLRKLGMDAGIELCPVPCNGLAGALRATPATGDAGHVGLQRATVLLHGSGSAQLHAGGGAAGWRCEVPAGRPAAALACDGAAGAGCQCSRFCHPCRRRHLRLVLLAGSGAQPESCGWSPEGVSILEIGCDSWRGPAGLLLHGTSGARYACASV
jgi:hypothetical protein